jgi:hypothetical protein
MRYSTLAVLLPIGAAIIAACTEQPVAPDRKPLEPALDASSSAMGDPPAAITVTR